MITNQISGGWLFQIAQVPGLPIRNPSGEHWRTHISVTTSEGQGSWSIF